MKTYNFCTLFDSNYLLRGVTMYRSLLDTGINFHLYIYAFDDLCYTILSELKLAHTTIIALKDFEYDELLAVKPNRNRAEYCWTCSSSTIWHSINKYALSHCTYLDSDLYFYRSPEIIFDEIGENAVGLSEHFHGSDIEGRFCVQFVYFKNDSEGMNALDWWRKSCLDWCYARYEDGKFGDQKYLDYLPQKFNKVKIITHRGAGVAPWNMAQYKFLENNQFLFQGKKLDMIFFHFHGLKIRQLENKWEMEPATFNLQNDQIKYIFKPYIEKMLEADYFIFPGKKGTVFQIKIKKRPFYLNLIAWLKSLLRNNKFVRFIYYDVLKVRYNGHK